MKLETQSRLIKVGELVELEVGGDIADSPRYNDDIAPTKAAQRTWTQWNVASLWVGMAICVPTYTLGGVLTSYFGLSVSEALWTIFIANIVVLIPLTLNAYPGTRYGIPCPVVLRASFGIIGSNVPALIRALVACKPWSAASLFTCYLLPCSMAGRRLAARARYTASLSSGLRTSGSLFAVRNQ